MSPAKPEISHWGSSFSEHKFGTSDNPKTREGKFVSVDQIPDTGLNPEEALLAKEEGEIEEETKYPEYNSLEEAIGSYEIARAARRQKEKNAGLPRKTPEAKVESLTDHIDAERIQRSHDETITKIKQEIKGKTQKLSIRRSEQRPDEYKDRRTGKVSGKKSIREIAA